MSGPLIRDKHIPFEPFLYNVAEEIKLPTVGEGNDSNLGFLEVFSSRRSIKSIGTCPLGSLSKVLYYTLKPHSIEQDDFGVTVYRSAVPSAGGRHPIDILVGSPQEKGRRLFLYQPLNHSLRRLVIDDESQQAFFDDVEQTLPLGDSTLLWFCVQYMRTASKYSDYMSLVWRDIGAELCCLQQAAKYVGLDSCPIGYLAEESFHSLFKTDKLISGGGMIVGERLI